MEACWPSSVGLDRHTKKGVGRFCEELIARVDRVGASGVKLLRADSGF